LTPNIILGLGQSYALVRDDASARKYFERLIRNYPDNEFVGEAYLAIGQTYIREGNMDAALKSFAQARESGRLDAAAQAAVLSGDVYFQKGDHDAARKSYEDAIALQTSWSQTAYVDLAAIAKQEKKYAEAIDFLEKAAGMQGAQKTADIRFQIAELWEESGDYDRALEAYLNVHYLFEKDEAASAKALLRVARIYERMENRTEMRKVLEKVASLNVPEAKYAAEKLRNFEEKD
jgi:tetratricopeptide (TPR) repeat protein